MTRLIENDQQLRWFLPNAFATARGETTIFDKIKPWLEQAEQWVYNMFVGSEHADRLTALETGNPVRITAAAVAAHEALRCAVPSLDLVLTPNGFGIVSNQNVAPASRERVERLVASLEASRDYAIEQLIDYLFRWEDWYDGNTRRWFTATLFPNIDLTDLCGITEHRWEKYIELRTRAIEIEMEIANAYVSPEQMNVLRDEVLAPDFDFSMQTTQHNHVIVLLRSVVVAAIKGAALNITMLRDIVDYMRKNGEGFVPFMQSDTFKLFEPPIFENKKKANGYWF